MALETTRPNRGPPVSDGSGSPGSVERSRTCTTSVRLPARRPPLMVRLNSAGEVSLCRLGSTDTAALRLRGHAGAAPTATCRNDGAAGAGAHAGADAVLAGTAAVVRLERLFALCHGGTPYVWVAPAPTGRPTSATVCSFQYECRTGSDDLAAARAIHTRLRRARHAGASPAARCSVPRALSKHIAGLSRTRLRKLVSVVRGCNRRF